MKGQVILYDKEGNPTLDKVLGEPRPIKKESCVDNNILNNFNFDTWETKPMGGEDGTQPAPVFCPKIRFRGHQPEFVSPRIAQSFWRKGPNNEPVIEYSVTVHGTFADALELDK